MNFQDQVGGPLPLAEHFIEVSVPALMVTATPDPSPLMFIKSTSIVLIELRAMEKSPLDTMIGPKRIMNVRCVRTAYC